ncbi:BRO family, N-terminal domain [Azotobacter beijerinckii]|uniref:BRO family, N-terminal domain n=1 Tax=Azotobacter beijerinckii TaxID=170623 RepID=A0A1H9RPN2_9GAMM|nr:phage antirepressor N-terminal domain-containing protein [Azotobacter beijerinckii]SER74921.1 BRO family, N-terminal domain [Azotobacter beijerinckii]
MSTITSQLGTVSFQGHDLTVITTDSGERFVAMKPICEAIGLSWNGQYERIQRHEVLKTCVRVTRTEMPGDDQHRELVCLPLDYLNGWLFGVDASRVKPEIRERLVQYQRECFAALAAYWQQGEAINPRTVLPAGNVSAPLRLTYNDRHFRIVPVGTEVWFVAADVASAVGLRDSHVATRHLRPEHKATLPVGRQTLNVISQAGLELALLHAHPERVAPFRAWLAEALNLLPTTTAAPEPERPPVASLSLEARNFTLDYLERCRQAVIDAGGTLPAWNQEADQRISDNMAALLISDKRWLLTFGDRGEPQLQAIPREADIFTPESLLNWIRNPFGARPDYLPVILQAIGERLSNPRRR